MATDSLKVPEVSGKFSVFLPDIFANRDSWASMYYFTDLAKLYFTYSHIISSKMIFKFEICSKRSK
jgi:hypothetical protein